MIRGPVVLTCSTCDDYRLVPGESGLLEGCPDCGERCRVHGAVRVVDSHCAACLGEVSLAEALFARARQTGRRGVAA